MVTTPVLVTFEESLLRPESSLEEVIEGELHIMPPATFPHNIAIRKIQQMLDRSLNINLDLVWETGFLIAERPRLRYRIPDLAVVDAVTAELFLSQQTDLDPYARFTPLAVIEVLSPSNRKGRTDQLLQDYRDLGVEEIVFLNPKSRIVSVNGEQCGTLSVAGVLIDLEPVWRLFN